MRDSGRWSRVTAVCLLVVGGLAGLNGYRDSNLAEKRIENIPPPPPWRAGAVGGAAPPVRIEHAKGETEWPALFEEWNSFSRIRVRKEVPWLAETEPSGWGMSSAYKDDPSVPERRGEMVINIDAGAGTVHDPLRQPRGAAPAGTGGGSRLAGAVLRRPGVQRRQGEGDRPKEARQNRSSPRRRSGRSPASGRGGSKSVEAANRQAGFLKYDVTNFAHFLRPDSRVLVIGSGGGRDLLSALVFNQKHVTGVEINPAIIKAMRQTFGDFTGHLDRLPNVEIVHDEARSYITRLKDKVDIIQISLIDTWAATAAGAFVLSENSLYTTDAWRAFLGHLTDRGVVTVSRWYHPQSPGETIRMVSLANEALREIGVTDPQHILIVKRYQAQQSTDIPSVVATTIVSRTPFSDADLALAEKQAKAMQFDLILTPKMVAGIERLAAVADSKDPYATAKTFPIKLSRPSDDKPFFST